MGINDISIFLPLNVSCHIPFLIESCIESQGSSLSIFVQMPSVFVVKTFHFLVLMRKAAFVALVDF